MRSKLLAAASAAALGIACTPALAAPAAGGYVDVGYAAGNCSGCSDHTWDYWNFSGAAETPLGSSPVTLQGDASYTTINVSHFPVQAHFSQQNLSLIFNADMGKLGAAIGRNEIGFGPESSDGTTYGAFGVVYPTKQITLGLKGGALEFGSGAPHISYWGAEAKGYVCPNVSLGMTYDDGRFGHINITTWGGGVEWQPTAQPWSARLGYESNRFSSFATINSVMLNFRWRFGGGSTLVDHDRNGAEPWGTQQSAINYID